MEGQQVEYVLHLVTLVENGTGHGVGGVGGVIHAQPVGFVVEHVVLAAVFEHQIDKALEHAVEGVRFQSRAGQVRVDGIADGLIQ